MAEIPLDGSSAWPHKQSKTDQKLSIQKHFFRRAVIFS